MTAGRFARLVRRRTTADATPPAAIAVERVGATSVIVLPGVFNGVRFYTGAFLAETVAEIARRDDSVLDLGTGSGVCALFAAFAARRVIATDVNPEAVRCAEINALAHHVEHKVVARAGDLFSTVPDERFDLVLFNPPYFRGQPVDTADHALRSLDTFERFLRELPDHLLPGGRALVVLSPDTDIESSLAAPAGLTVSILRTRRILDKTLTIYDLRAN